MEEFESYDEWELQQLKITSYQNDIEIEQKENNDMVSRILETATLNKIQLQEELIIDKNKRKTLTHKKQYKDILKNCSDNVNFLVIQRINFTNQTLLLVI